MARRLEADGDALLFFAGMVITLAAFVFLSNGGRGVWSTWYQKPYMPALRLECFVTDGMTSFAWCYQGCGAVLCGTSTAGSGPSDWGAHHEVSTLAAVVVGLTVGRVADGLLRPYLGMSGAVVASAIGATALFIWVRTWLISLSNRTVEDGGRPTTRCR